MRCFQRYVLVSLIPLLAGVFFAACSPAYAEGSSELEVIVDEKVIYCSAMLNGSDDAFLHAMKDGISVSTVWYVRVDRVRDYWLNKNIAKIAVVRRVVPDLLSRSWLLEDVASGISQRVYDLSAATRFLANLEQFPVLDKSLLESGALYVMNASVELYTGEVNDAWWASLLKPEEASMKQVFQLP
ncbi:protein of unknown function (DUF4390) [Mariprofundus ferrinatatus]|uniref:DUF4390 domain-containing protein n=1 Tax=Mariprofundus ferrinatatus TaxID=1921087 RepID=A0A2K8L9E1_9PROT|nr:DUF4390 domain-containing protein [Mariprofundus ferrinatatus]ATX82501.1 protein of unknown function (DUF4390) [Mariprofundus ferrinatatus]